MSDNVEVLKTFNSEQIKNEINYLYGQINKAEDQIKVIRSICPHEHTFEGKYEYRIAASFPALICSDCGQVVKSLI